jgi:phosphomannomutase
MSETTTPVEVTDCLEAVKTAQAEGKITDSAVENLTAWLTQSRYSDFVPGIVDHIQKGMWQELDNVFWTVIPFGTGGRRGMMYPFGSNAINTRTIGESAQGLADYVKQIKPDGPWSMAIAYDTRHRSREFAELCASIMVANGFEVFFIDDYRSTPQLSFLTRYKDCDCGIMVTASHNPPCDNAVKVYWSTGGQLVPPHDKAVIDRVEHVNEIPTADFDQAVSDGKIHFVKEETDKALMDAEIKHSFPGPRDIKIIYSPLHGVGEFNVSGLLAAAGFEDVEIYEPHRKPDGDFPNVPDHVSNPENTAVFDAIIERAKDVKADLILATDPDCDRMGAAAPLTTDPKGEWGTFNGNQLGVLLADYILRQRKSNNDLTSDHFVVTTLVTTEMINRVCETFGVTCYNRNLVGFKWIASVMDERGADHFVFGTEESHGFLVGEYCRDKDGAVACMLMSELAAWVKSQGKSLFQYLDELYLQHGFHLERTINIRMEGSDGMKRMAALLEKFRVEPPKSLGKIPVVSTCDYAVGKRIFADGATEGIDGPTGNVLVFETELPGNYVAARPSGTEPKVKFYTFTKSPVESISDLPKIRQQMEERINDYATDMQAFADQV